MYNSDTDLLFPSRAISALHDLRGEAWQALIEQLIPQESTSLDRLAFVLLMARIGNCMVCHADSFRALHGCTECARQAVRRYRGDDETLLASFLAARNDVEAYLGGFLHGTR